jgi:agmatine deiminase
LDPSQYRIPGEFEPHRALWLSYDAGHEEVTAALAALLAPRTRLKLLVRDADAAEAARTLLASRRVPLERVEFHVEPSAMYFVRDAVVWATGVGAAQGRLGVVDFAWNEYGRPGWCRQVHPADEALRSECTGNAERTRNDLDRWFAAHAQGPVFESPLFMEGGGVESNGRGLLIACGALLRQRHPDTPLEALWQEHLKLPGVRKVIVLPEGLAEDPPLRSTLVDRYVAWGTGGHTDEFVRFADPRTVLLAWPDDADVAAHPVARLNRQRMQRNLAVLQRATDADGQPLRVVRVPMPRTVERRVFLSAAADPAWSREWSAAWFPPQERKREGDWVMQVASASYLNFVIANGLVIAPGYTAHGTPRAVEDRVRRTLEGAFPGREVRFVDALGLNWVGGGPHCATLHEPDPAAALRG